jgi:hypothetical protein
MSDTTERKINPPCQICGVEVDELSNPDRGWEQCPNCGHQQNIRKTPPMTDEYRYGIEVAFTCPCCRLPALRAFRGPKGKGICGFCWGVGPDGMATGKHGRHP